MPAATVAETVEATVRPLREADADRADEVMRIAFGTFLGRPEPGQFMGDASFVRPRSRGLATGWVAERDGEVVGSTMATRWGSFAFFGPLSVAPELWDRGVGQRLMAPVEEAFERWGIERSGLFTCADSCCRRQATARSRCAAMSRRRCATGST